MASLGIKGSPLEAALSTNLNAIWRDGKTPKACPTFGETNLMEKCSKGWAVIKAEEERISVEGQGVDSGMGASLG